LLKVLTGVVRILKTRIGKIHGYSLSNR
jgi:hypothetical protein